jgi:MarR-like DNA-binding transcriptional regulator SgrR of sgrS sRNA
MKVIDHYIALQRQHKYVPLGEPVSITRKQIANFLYCSERNVVHLIRNLQ